MHFSKKSNNFLSPDIMKYECTKANKVSAIEHRPPTKVLSQSYSATPDQNFAHGLQNARNLLEGLEHSLSKTSRYETRLLRCKAAHAHSHDWWESDRSEDREGCSGTETTKPSRGQVDLAESWSTISIVCLQYQYEELSKKYSTLLHAYHESCTLARGREASLARLHAHTRRALAQLARAHRTLIAVGDKYLNLCHKKQVQKSKYEGRIKRLRAMVRGVRAMCEQARVQLDTAIVRVLQAEGAAPNAQLLAEIRKCNLLFLENLRLKAQIEELASGKVLSEIY